VGGTFNVAGGKPSVRVARWDDGVVEVGPGGPPAGGAAVELGPALPIRSGLDQRRLVLAGPERVRLTVHDLRGRRVATLVDGERPAGGTRPPGTAPKRRAPRRRRGYTSSACRQVPGWSPGGSSACPETRRLRWRSGCAGTARLSSRSPTRAAGVWSSTLRPDLLRLPAAARAHRRRRARHPRARRPQQRRARGRRAAGAALGAGHRRPRPRLLQVRGIPAFHDEVKGKQRGANTVYRIAMAGSSGPPRRPRPPALGRPGHRAAAGGRALRPARRPLHARPGQARRARRVAGAAARRRHALRHRYTPKLPSSPPPRWRAAAPTCACSTRPSSPWTATPCPPPPSSGCPGALSGAAGA